MVTGFGICKSVRREPFAEAFSLPVYKWQEFQLSDDSVTHADSIVVIKEGLDRIRLVHNGTLFTEQFHDLGTRFSRFPTKAGELLPWLVLAAANGISGLCRRCTGA